MDISSKKPTLLFGLKHYESRACVFLDPMSYPAQRKSVSLVEAKKDGKTFSEIVNGCKAIDKQSAPITHAAVYAQHKAPINESKAQRYYYSGWLIVDSKSTCQKRARIEDRCMKDAKLGRKAKDDGQKETNNGRKGKTIAESEEEVRT
ncbi:hypothetical protein G6F45_012881 [Rhizopus arrhizus]|nr:hypothetical protein G6F45_012881 [Rhizopus arrhizus]